MKSRLNYYGIAPHVLKPMLTMEQAIKAQGPGPTLVELIKTRASLINHCAFCIDMHIGRRQPADRGARDRGRAGARGLYRAKPGEAAPAQLTARASASARGARPRPDSRVTVAHPPSHPATDALAAL